MEGIAIAAIIGGGIVVLLAIVAHRPRLRPKEELARVERPTVRVLQDDEELRDALRRAAQFERDEADTRRRRADRYESQISVTPIADLRRDRRPPAPPAAGRSRSA